MDFGDADTPTVAYANKEQQPSTESQPMTGRSDRQQVMMQWMASPGYVPHCPPGLEYLTQIDQLLIHQQVELFEAFTNIETQNRYVIKNTLGQQCFYAFEESDFCMRYCCGPARGFVLHIVDNRGMEVIRLNRPFKCCAGCCWCADNDHCAFTVDVESPVGTPIGQIRQMQSWWRPYYEIIDGYQRSIFKLRGPCCVASGPCCTCDYPFEITTLSDGSVIGDIRKQYGGCVKEWFTDATNFSVTFPMDLDVKLKAVLLGATFLIDFMFFERQKNNK